MVVEDLISTGKSSLNAVSALKEEGANVKGMVAIFSYGFDIAINNFKEDHITLYTLSDYENLLDKAQSSKYINIKEHSVLTKWNADPENWLN